MDQEALDAFKKVERQEGELDDGDEAVGGV